MSSPLTPCSAAEVIDAATLCSTSPVLIAYGRICVMRCWARVRRAPATIFMARVIFCVALVLVMRFLIDLSEGMGSLRLLLLRLLLGLLLGLLVGLALVLLRRGALAEAGAELLERLLHGALEVLVD